jgi:hypothetical protein
VLQIDTAYFQGFEESCVWHRDVYEACVWKRELVWDQNQKQ